MLCTLAAACAPFRPGLPGEPTLRERPDIARYGQGAVLAQDALALLGTPYRFGGSDPSVGLDCSGLVTYLHGRLGIAVPRTAAAQFAASRPVDRTALQPGDLVFFRLVPGSREVTHVGVYIGSGRFIHAPQTGRNVEVASLDDTYFSARYAGAGRFHADSAGAGPQPGGSSP
jgi:cell wall-associated NlpC family hydrolase